MLEILIKEMTEWGKATEKLKVNNQIEWVQRNEFNKK